MNKENNLVMIKYYNMYVKNIYIDILDVNYEFIRVVDFSTISNYVDAFNYQKAIMLIDKLVSIGFDEKGFNTIILDGDE